MITVVMPTGASAGGEAFELLASRYLSAFSGLQHVATPFYRRLERGRWVQFDGLFARADGNRLVLEAKFYGEPVSLATPGISARVTFAKEAGVKGIIIASRAGFAPDIIRVKLSLEKVLLSWKAMRSGLEKREGGLVTAGLDRVVPWPYGYCAESGARLITSEPVVVPSAMEGFAFLPPKAERWLRRLPAAPGDIDLAAPPCGFRAQTPLDIVSAWTIEDSLRGFAPASPQLLEKTVDALKEGPFDLVGAWKALWRRGFRGRRGAIKNALDDLCVMGVAEKSSTDRGLAYCAAGATAPGEGSDAADALARALLRWPAFQYFRPAAGTERGKNALSAALTERFTHLFPYARSLYNPAKVAGLLALDNYLSGTSSTSPS